VKITSSNPPRTQAVSCNQRVNYSRESPDRRVQKLALHFHWCKMSLNFLLLCNNNPPYHWDILSQGYQSHLI
jgi:hypothetical protein